MIISYLKEVFRPTRILMIFRHIIQIRTYKNKKLILGYYSTLNNVKIGTNIFIGNNCSIVNSDIGSHSYCNINTHIKNSSIGKYTSIGSDVNICIGAHPTNMVSTHPAFYSNNKAFDTFADKLYYDELNSVRIGNDVWIGSNSTIMSNVNIGDGAIVAYGAVVTKDVMPYSIVGGIPARHLKFRFDEHIIERLMEIKWWELSDSFLKQHYKLFHNPLVLINFFDSEKEFIEKYRNK